MGKSFCSGCKYWTYAKAEQGAPAFFYCWLLAEYKLSVRKELCNGKFYEKKV